MPILFGVNSSQIPEHRYICISVYSGLMISLPVLLAAKMQGMYVSRCPARDAVDGVVCHTMVDWRTRISRRMFMQAGSFPRWMPTGQMKWYGRLKQLEGRRGCGIICS